MDCLSTTSTFSDCANVLTAIGAIVAVIITAFVGRATVRAANETAKFTADAVKEAHQNTQSQIAGSLLDDYADPLMLEATNRLREWHQAHPGTQYTSDFDNLRFSDATAQTADHARRRLAHYFSKAAVISRNKLLDKPLLLEVISPNQVTFARQFVEPLDRVVAAQIKRDFNSRDYEELAGLRSSTEPVWLNPDTQLKAKGS